MKSKKENAPAVESRRIDMQKHDKSVPLWDAEAQLAVLVPILILCVVIAVCEVTGC
ncbi:MAG: hypothetical protein RR178_09415 [Gordonibacter sp.]